MFSLDYHNLVHLNLQTHPSNERGCALGGLETHREDSEVEDYPGGSPKYDDDDDDGFVTAGGFETDRASQASGHGGRVLIVNDKKDPVEPLLVGRQARPCVGVLDLRSVSSGGATDQRPNDCIKNKTTTIIKTVAS